MKKLMISGFLGMLLVAGLSLPQNASADGRHGYGGPVYGGATVSARIGDVRIGFGVPLVVAPARHVVVRQAYCAPRPVVIYRTVHPQRWQHRNAWRHDNRHDRYEPHRGGHGRR